MIVVTGGLGFIGSNLIHQLNLNGVSDIIIVDDFKMGSKWKNIRDLKFVNVFSKESFLENISFILEEVTEVYHLGACSSTTELNMDYLWKNNVIYSQNLFTECASKEIPLVYASSAATYGNGNDGYEDSHDLCERLRPLNPYGYSKKLFDDWVLKEDDTPPVWAGVKFFNVFGPQEFHKESMRSVPLSAYEQITQKGKLKLFKSYNSEYPDGGQKRDFIYVEDAVSALMELMKNIGPETSGIYNLGRGRAETWNDLAKACFKALDKEVNIEYIDMPEGLKENYQYYTKAKMTKFLQVCPDFKFQGLEESIKKYFAILSRDWPYLNSNQVEFNES